MKRRTLPADRLPHVIGFALVLGAAAVWLGVPFWILAPVWFVFFFAMSEPV